MRPSVWKGLSYLPFHGEILYLCDGHMEHNPGLGLIVIFYLKTGLSKNE